MTLKIAKPTFIYLKNLVLNTNNPSDQQINDLKEYLYYKILKLIHDKDNTITIQYHKRITLHYNQYNDTFYHVDYNGDSYVTLQDRDKIYEL